MVYYFLAEIKEKDGCFSPSIKRVSRFYDNLTEAYSGLQRVSEKVSLLGTRSPWKFDNKGCSFEVNDAFVIEK